jgi:transcriptional regulator with XRE-family HTH domain
MSKLALTRRTKSSEEIDWKQVGHRIRELRGLYMKQAEFAARVGVSQSFLSTVEHGKVEVGAAILLRISREFGQSIEWLLTGKDYVPGK